MKAWAIGVVVLAISGAVSGPARASEIKEADRDCAVDAVLKLSPAPNFALREVRVSDVQLDKAAQIALPLLPYDLSAIATSLDLDHGDATALRGAEGDDRLRVVDRTLRKVLATVKIVEADMQAANVVARLASVCISTPNGKRYLSIMRRK